MNWNIRHEPSCAVHGLTYYVVPIVNTRPIVNTNRQRCGGPLDVRTPVSVPSTLARPKALAVVLLYHVGLLMPCGSSTVIRLNGRHATPVSQFSPGGKSTATTITYVHTNLACYTAVGRQPHLVPKKHKRENKTRKRHADRTRCTQTAVPSNAGGLLLFARWVQTACRHPPGPGGTQRHKT